MPGQLTTHVLDLAAGQAAAGVAIRVSRLGDGEQRQVIRDMTTNEQGRTAEAVIAEGELTAGTYELLFDVGSYFHHGLFELVPIRVTITDPNQHYHVPLLITPWSYSTYRGN